VRFIHDISRQMTNLINLGLQGIRFIAYRRPIAHGPRECVIRTPPSPFLELVAIIVFHG
jgi:hypothetical protein